MQRQSLGSPAAKLHANGAIIIKETSSPLSSSSSSSSELMMQLQMKSQPNDDYDEDEKSQKKSHKTTPSGEKFIHLIPLLTLFCILVLYLFSHDPSQNDLAQINGFKILSKPIDSTVIGYIQRVLEVEVGKSDILAIGSLRNLQGLENPTYRINNRKIGYF